MITALDRLGRRGAMLFTLGATYVLLGVGHLVRPTVIQSGVPHTYLPDWVSALIWGVPGVIAIAAAIWRRSDSWGWPALYIPPALRITSYLIGVGYWLMPGGVPGYLGGLWGALVYLPLVLAVLICSGWREPVPMPMPQAKRADQ